MKYIGYAFIIGFLFSCINDQHSDKKQKSIEILKISEIDLLQNNNLSELISGFSLVPLETDSACLIMDIKKVIFHKNYYYILDESAQKILQFTSTGKFVKQISSRGEGPGEFLEIHDFAIDTKRDILYVPDYFKLHMFKLDGTFIKSLQLAFMGSDFALTKENRFIFYGGFEDFRLRVTDSLGNIVSSYVPYSKINNAAGKYPFSSVETNVFFHLPACDTIFQIKNGKPEPAYFIDFGNKAYNQEFFDNLPSNLKDNIGNYLNHETDRLTFFSFLPTTNFIFLQLSYSNNYYSGYYDKQTKKQLFINHNKFENDMFNSFFFFNPVGTIDDKYIIAVPSYKFIDNQEANLLSTEENQKIINQLNKYSNPVLMIVNPKTIG